MPRRYRDLSPSGSKGLAAANRELRAALAAEPDDPASLLVAAKVAQHLGQFQQAIEYCRRAAFDARDPALLEIASDSYLKPLHRDPRYQALLRRLKLPQQA